MLHTILSNIDLGMFFVYTVKCDEVLPIVRILKAVYTVLQWLIPIALIIFGVIDLGKAVISSKEDEMKKAQGALLKRFIYAVAVFLVFTLVTFVMGIVADSTKNDDVRSSEKDNNWAACWKRA